MTHRFGDSASNILLHRAADQELADDGGIAPLDYENKRHVVPLTEMPWNGRITAIWVAIGLSLITLSVVAVRCAT